MTPAARQTPSSPADDRRSQPVYELAQSIVPDEGALAAARAAIRAWLSARDVDERAFYGVELVLEELVGNTIRYGYEGANGEIGIHVSVDPSTILVSITDDARPFDPTVCPDPDPPRSIAEARVGGLGIAMVRGVARAMRYRREEGRNRLEVEVARRA